MHEEPYFLALLLMFLAVGIMSIFYLKAIASLANAVLSKVDYSRCRELSQLRSKGYALDSPNWPRVVRNAKDTVDYQKECIRTSRHRTWTELTDYKWMGDFVPEGCLRNRECAARSVDEKTAPERKTDASWRKKQNAPEGFSLKRECAARSVEEENAPERKPDVSWRKRQDTLEDPPNGVSVAALKGACGYFLVYRRRRIGRIVMGLIWIMASGLGVCSFGSSISEFSAIRLFFPVIACILGCSYLKRELFGKNTLMLTSSGGDYTASGSIFWGRWEDFPLSRKTVIHYRTRKGLFNIEYRDIAIKNRGLEEIRFGSSMPNEVQDYLCTCMSRWASGRPLSITQGKAWHANLKYPFLFFEMIIMTVISLVYATSYQERVTVWSGKVQIVESGFWGVRENITEIPVRDIAHIAVEEWRGRRGAQGRYLRIVGHDDKTIATIDGLNKAAYEYKKGLESALDGSSGRMFERKRNIGGWYWLLALSLGLAAAMLCGDGDNQANRVDGNAKTKGQK